MPGPTSVLEGSLGFGDVALDVSGLGAWEWTASTGETRWQGPCKRILGLDPDGPGIPFSEFLDWVEPEDMDRIHHAASAMESGDRFDVTFRVRPPDGRLRWIRLRGRRVDRDGDLRMAGVMEDVSSQVEADRQGQLVREALEQSRRNLEAQVSRRTAELREANAQLTRSEQMLRTIVESAPAIIQTIDRDANVLTANRGTLRGIEDFVGRCLFDYLKAEDRQNLRLVLERVFELGQTVYFEAEAPNGRWFGGNFAPIVEEGRTAAAILVMSDVTTRREVEEAARRSEALFRDLADSMPIMMWLMAADGRPTWANRAVFDFVGYHPGAPVRGTSRLHPDDSERVVAEFLDCLARRAPFYADVRLERCDGEYRSCLVTALPRRDATGEFAGYVASCVDLTELRQAEARATQRRDELAQALRVESLDQLTLGLAHELHQPLAAISAAMGAVLRGIRSDTPDLPRLREMIEEGQRQALRAGALVEQMRDFIRRGVHEQAEVDIHDLVADVVSLVGPEAHRRGVKLLSPTKRAGLVVWASRLQLQQVLINLLQNGIQAMLNAEPSERTLRIEVDSMPRDEISIRVRDTGMGISRDHEQEIFDVFFTTRSDGLGLGLAISRSIVEAHGGSLRADNHPEGGAVFTVVLPAAPRDLHSTPSPRFPAG